MPNGNGEDPKIPHPQGTVPGLDTPFETSKHRLEDFSGGSIDGFWQRVLSTPPTKGEVAKYYPLSAIDTTGRYNYFAPYRDTEESYARGQSRWDKMGNGLTKMGGLAVGTFLEGTAGAVYGLGKWIENGKFSSLYDNDFNRSIDQWNKDLENKFPHYYTHRELDADWYEPSAWFTSNFLWDKVVKNLGFAAGAIATGNVYSAALKGIGLTGWLVRQGKSIELLSALEETLPTASKVGRMEAFSKAAGDLATKYGYKPFGNILQKSDRILTAAMATSGEASIEALNNLNEFRNNAIQEWKEKYGVAPTGENLKRINEQAEHVGNWSFGLNVALLSATNYIQLPKILGSSYKAEKSIANNIATQPLERDAVTGLYKSALPQAGVKKLLTKSKNLAGLFFAPVEGFEEGAQYAIQRGTENYFGKKMAGEKVNWLEDGLGYGVSETLNSREGMENILIGGLSGGLMTAKASIGQRGVFGYDGKEAKATNEALAGLNKSSFKKQLQDYAEASKRAQTSQERRAMFIRQGDILEAKEEEFDFTHDYLLPRIKYGKIAGVKQDLEMYKQLSVTPQGMEQLKSEGIATPDDTQQTFLSRIAAIEEHANVVNGLYSALNQKYSGIVNEKGERKYSDDIIDRLVYSAAKIKNYDGRTSTLSANLSVNGVDASAILADIKEEKDPSAIIVKEQLDNINSNNSLTTDEKDDVKRELQDLMEIAMRRNKFMNEYNSIREKPESYKPKPLTEEELKSPKVKYGEKELEVGRAYSLKDSFTREGNKLLLAPKLTILSKTLQGEYEVKLPSGRHAFLTPKELENYQLSEVDNISPAINKALTDAIKEVFGLKKYEDLKDKLPTTLAEALDYINALDNVELSNDIVGRVSAIVKAEQEKKAKEEAELAEINKLKDAKDKVFKSQAELKTVPVTITPTADDILKDTESRKKAARIVFSSTTSASEVEVPDTQASPRLLRERNFMFNQSFFKNRADYRIITVTQNQEEKLGLKGLIESVAKDDKERDYTNTDVDKAPILAIYTISEKGQLFFVDENGKKIGKVGAPIDLDKLVVSTLANTSTTWRDGNSRFRKEDQDQAGEFAEQWRKEREKMFATENYSIFEFSVSRGLPSYDSYEEDGETKFRENSPTNSLFPASEKDKVLNTEGILVVAVTDAISHNGVNYGTKQGRLYFQYADRFAPLTNRQFTPEEQEAIYQTLLTMADQAKENKGISGRYMNFLKGVLYFGRPLDTSGNSKTPGRNQVWIDQSFFLNFGNNGQKIAFIRTAIENKKELLFEFLNGAYNNINNAILRDEFHTPFEEFYIDKSGKYVSRQWKNYQYFLLDSELPYLKTPLRQLSPSVPNDRNFKQKYAILHGVEFKAKEQSKAEAKPKAEKKEGEIKIKRIEFADGHIDGRVLSDGKVEIISFVYKGQELPANPAKQAAREAIFLNGLKEVEEAIKQKEVPKKEEVKKTETASTPKPSTQQDVKGKAATDDSIKDTVVVSAAIGGFKAIDTSNIKKVTDEKGNTQYTPNEGAGTTADIRRRHSDEKYEIILDQETKRPEELFRDINHFDGHISSYRVKDKKNGKTYLVVNVASRKIGKGLNADRDGQIFVNVEDTGNLPTNILTILKKRAIDEVNKDAKKPNSTFEPVKQAIVDKINAQYNAELKESESKQAITKETKPSTQGEVEAEPIKPTTEAIKGTEEKEVSSEDYDYKVKNIEGRKKDVTKEFDDKIYNLKQEEELSKKFEIKIPEADDFVKGYKFYDYDNTQRLGGREEWEVIKSTKENGTSYVLAKSLKTGEEKTFGDIKGRLDTIQQQTRFANEEIRNQPKQVNVDRLNAIKSSIDELSNIDMANADNPQTAKKLNSIIERLEEYTSETRNDVIISIQRSNKLKSDYIDKLKKIYLRDENQNKGVSYSEKIKSLEQERDKQLQELEKLKPSTPKHTQGEVEEKKADIKRDKEVALNGKEKFTLNRSRRELNFAPLIDYNEVDWEKSGLTEMKPSDVAQVRVLEYRGRNEQGERVGTIRVLSKDEVATEYEVKFNDQATTTKYDTQLAALEGKKEEEKSLPIVGAKPKEIKIKGRKDEEFRIARTFNVDRMGFDEKRDFTLFMEKKLPQFNVEEMTTLIQATGDRVAWGKLMRDTISYYEKAEKGTGYHEAFEGVWKYFLSPTEKAAINNEVVSREGTFVDRETGQDTEFKGATEKQVKEVLADEFADFKIGKKVTIGSRIRAFFNRIMKFFRTFLRGYQVNKSLVNELFDKIEVGGFTKYKLPKTFDNSVEYREITGLTAAQTHGFVQDILANFMIELFNEGADMFEIENYARSDIFDIIKAKYSEEEEGVSTISQFPEGEKTFNDLVQKVKKVLAAYSITFDEEGQVSVNDENQTRVEYDSSSQKMTMDVRKTQPFAVKLLLATLYKTTDRTTSAGMPIPERGIVDNYQLLQSSRTTITLLETALGATSVDDMIDKLKTLAKENSDYVRLLRRMGFDINKGNDLSFGELTPEKFRLLSGFYDSFNKQKPFVRELVSENDGVFFRDMHIGSASKQIFSVWENAVRRNARNGNAIFLPYDKKEKQYKIDQTKLNEYKADIASKLKSTSEEQLRFLNDIGIIFPKDVYGRMNIKQKDAFSNAINRILTYLTDKGGLKIIKADIVGINGPLTTLSEIYAKITKPDAESTFLNGENKQQQVFIQPNYVSQFENVFNSVKDVKELKEKIPWLNDVYSKHSQVLTLGGIYFNIDGERTDVELKNGYVNAATKDSRRKLLKDADYPERLATQINSILNSEDKRQSVFYMSVPADASTEYAITLPSFISYKELLNTEESNNKIFEAMFGYLQDEIELAKEGRTNANIGKKGNELRFFKNILSPKMVEIVNDIIKSDKGIETLDKEALKLDILAFITAKTSQTERVLAVNGLIEELPDGEFTFPSLLSSYAETNGVNKFQLKGDEFNRIVKQFWLNNFIAQTELHKVLFGDPYNFAIKGKVMDETKRIKSFLSPAQSTITSKYYNNLFNDVFNVAGGVTLTDPMLGYYNFRDYNTSSVIKEIQTVGQIINERPEYKGIKEADAQAAHTIEMHRDLKNRHFKWGKKEEQWYQFEKSYERLRRNLKGQLKDENYPKALRAHDTDLIGWNGETSTKQKPIVFLNVEKPIVRGIKSGKVTIDPVMDKFSSAPIFYSAVEGTTLEDVYLQMMQDGVDYIILESGRKVGAEEYRDFYNQDGTLNKTPFINKTNISWNDYYIQQENVYDEVGRQTRGTQTTKLFSLDFFSGGEPLDGDPEIAEKAAHNDQLLNALTVNGYNRVLDRFGLVDNGTYFAFKGENIGREKLMDTLRKEAYRRDMPDNLRDIFEPDPLTGHYNIPFEATSEYTKIQKMLYSLADRDILTQHYNGGQRTQMSVMGWENRLKGREIVLKEGEGENISYRRISRKEYGTLSDKQKESVHLTSSRLKFYSKNDRYMEVLLPNWFRKKLDPNNSKTDAEILEFLKSGEGKRILQGIGFRIPTQAMSQIEAIRVAGFLAPEMGDTVVVPSEITTKSGSDFDIDKLNMYLKNVYIGKNGFPYLIELSKIDTNNDDELKSFYEDNVLRKYKIFKETEKITSSELSTDALFELLGFEPQKSEIIDNLEGKYIPDLEEFIVENKGTDWFELNKKFHRRFREALENEYIENLEWFISHPKNYDRLVTPTEEGDLKPLAAEIAELTEGEDKEDLTKLLDINYLSSLRQSFMSAKKWIGIVVNGITSHAQSQRLNVFMDVKNTKLSIKDREIIKDGNILISHNKDAEGRPTISVIKNSAGKYISDILSWFCTAMVDVAKDPYITKVIHNRKLVPVFTFMTRLGVPIRELVFFMNQPIIREYMKYSDEKGFSKVANEYWREQFMTLNKFTSKDTAKELNEASYKDVIKKYYDGTPLTDEENAHQKLVLDEFLKYFRMSEFLFGFTQATNWDTADFKTGGSVFKKQVIEQRENRTNIFKTPKTFLDNSFLRTMANAMGLMRDAIGVLSRFDNAEVRNELDKVLLPYVTLTSFQSSDTTEKIDTTIVSGYIDYLIQTNTRLNSVIPNILIEESTSVAGMVLKIQSDQDLLKLYNNNPVFGYLKAQISNFERGGDNLILRPFPKQVYDKDLMTDSLRELRELSIGEGGEVDKKSLYSGIIRLALLQGTGNAANILPYIPNEDFAKIIMPLIGTNLREQAKAFYENTNYERNRWTDDDVVPEFNPLIMYNPYTFEYKYNINFPFAEWGGKVLRVSETYNSREIEYPVLKVRRAPLIRNSADRFDFSDNRLLRREGNLKEKINKGDFSFLDYIGYKKISLPNGEPLTKTVKDRGKWITYNFYKQINLMGDRNIQEHYVDQRPSVLDNQTVKIAEENIISDQTVIDRVNGKKGGDNNQGGEPKAPTPKPVTTAPVVAKVEPKSVPKVEPIQEFPEVTEIKRSGKKEKYNITLVDGKVEEREGYKLTIKEYPDFQGFIGREKGGWQVDEITTSKSMGGVFSTAKEALEFLKKELNKVRNIPQSRSILATVGIFTIQKNKDKLGFKKGDCK